jgi:hypothetical protein
LEEIDQVRLVQDRIWTRTIEFRKSRAEFTLEDRFNRAAAVFENVEVDDYEARSQYPSPYNGDCPACVNPLQL